MSHSTTTPTKAERDRLDRIHRIHRMPCIACMANMNFRIIYPTEAHHLVDKGYRVHSGGHMATLPLCHWHHRGVPLENYGVGEMLTLCGPSLALNKRAFVAKYGTERELLAKVNGILEQVAA